METFETAHGDPASMRKCSTFWGKFGARLGWDRHINGAVSCETVLKVSGNAAGTPHGCNHCTPWTSLKRLSFSPP